MQKINNILSSIKYFFIDLYIGIKNSLQYAKFGYSDRDYDHAFLIYLLEFKLKRMKKFFDNEGIASNKTRDRSLSLCINLLERLKEEENYSVNYNKFTKKWGDPDFYFKNGYMRMRSKREDRLSDSDLKRMKKEYKKAFDDDDAHRERDVALLFDTMKKYYKFWWD